MAAERSDGGATAVLQEKLAMSSSTICKPEQLQVTSLTCSCHCSAFIHTLLPLQRHH